VGYSGHEIGKIAQLLDRPWWRRVWIVQEVTLARKATLYVAPDEVPWDAIKMRMRDVAFAILGLNRNQALKSTPEGSAVAKYAFPSNEYILLSGLQEQWRQKWVSSAEFSEESLCNLLYKFRRFECTDPRDRIYAFFGLANDIKELRLVPNYASSISTIVTDVARVLIVAHKELLVFNLKREQGFHQNTAQQQSQVFNLHDQTRFLDRNGLVVNGDGKPSRKGGTRLPYGWERRQKGSRFRF
jgi:hypothetical protein